MARIPGLAACLLAGFGSSAFAQELLLDVPSPARGANASNGIAIGDWDGDGTGDLAIGAIRDSTAARQAGAARIHSGKDGSILAQWFGTNPNDYFGSNLARLPDLDGDGIDDLAVAAVWADWAGTDSGSIFIYAGRTGAFVRRIDGAGGTAFALLIGSTGDVDGDGIGDLFATQSYANNDDGEVYIYSGADGHEILDIDGSGGERFGQDVSVIDDHDGDGIDDLLVGAKWHQVNFQPVGAAHIVSTATGAILRSNFGTFGGEYLGYDVATLSDIDGDGLREYAVAARYTEDHSGSMVIVYAGATGAELARITSPSDTASIEPYITAIGDVNGDGFEDLGISGMWYAPGEYGQAAAFLVSGKTLNHLDRIELDEIGSILAPFGDLDGDGLGDLIFGSVDLSNSNGSVRVFSGNDLWLNLTPSHPESGDALELMTREGLPGALTAVVLEAIDGVPTFQWISGIGTFGSMGGRKLHGIVPPGLAGHDFQLRAYANDAAGRLIASAQDTIYFQ